MFSLIEKITKISNEKGKMNNKILKEYDDALLAMTRLSKEKRQEYIDWLGQQQEIVVLMIIIEHTKRLQAIRDRYRDMFAKKLIVFAALLETIALYSEADKDDNEIDYSNFWFGENDIRYAKKELKHLRNFGNYNE